MAGDRASGEESMRSPGLKERILVPLFLAGLVLLVYGPCLDNYFWEIDDQRHLANGAGGPFPNQYFRPLQAVSFKALWNVAGLDPFFYYLVGLVFHWMSACLLYMLARRLFSGIFPALAAALIFSTLFAPHQAVFWIGAHLGVQAVFFLLAALLAWLIYLEKGGFVPWLAALICAGLSVCFKETGLNLFPCMLILQLWARGFKDLFRPGRIAAWSPFLVLALWITWRAISVPGGVGLEAELQRPGALAGRLLRSLGLLPVPLEFEPWRFYPWICGMGLLVVTAPMLGALGIRAFNRNRTVPPGARVSTSMTAAAILLAGHAAVLPGEPEIIGERFYYDAAPGFALVLAALFTQARYLLRQRRWEACLTWAVLILWAAVQVAAIHRIEARKYDQVSRRVEALTVSTQTVLDKASKGATVVFLDPPLPDMDDFICILEVWFDIASNRIAESANFHPDDEQFRQRFRSKLGGAPFRWNEIENRWIPFDPGGEEWLDRWQPRYWPGGLKDPWLSRKVRFITIRL